MYTIHYDPDNNRITNVTVPMAQPVRRTIIRALETPNSTLSFECDSRPQGILYDYVVDPDNATFSHDPFLRNTVNQIRQDRNKKLAACDWTQVADNALTQTQRDAWATYRQALRDITLTYNNSTVQTQEQYNAIVWPTPPE